MLNVIGSQNNTRFIDDALNCGATSTEYYSDRDLVIGGALNVFGRKVTLVDCDAFTKEYYRKKYGLGNNFGCIFTIIYARDNFRYVLIFASINSLHHRILNARTLHI